MLAIASVTARALRRPAADAADAPRSPAAPVLLGAAPPDRQRRTAPDRLEPSLEGLLVSSVLPLVALVFGTAALGSELDDGTAVHILTKPIPRWTIILPKLVVAGGLTARPARRLDDPVRRPDRRPRPARARDHDGVRRRGRDRVVPLRRDLPGPERGDEPRADHRAGVRARLGGPARRARSRARSCSACASTSAGSSRRSRRRTR